MKKPKNLSNPQKTFQTPPDLRVHSQTTPSKQIIPLKKSSNFKSH